MLPTFYGDADEQTEAALSSIIAGMSANAPAMSAAPGIVLDVRDNRGGSGIWARRIAEAIWGRGALDALPPDGEGVDWRVSTDNIALLRADLDRIPADADTLDRRGRLDRRIADMTKASGAGRALMREANRPSSAVTPRPARRANPVYVLTDGACMSACLDAVDLWTSLGAVQIGQETNADTLYMELRDDALPSGLATTYVPMKVWRGRRRGSNVPAIPAYRFEGDMHDDEAVQIWVSSLMERNRAGP